MIQLTPTTDAFVATAASSGGNFVADTVTSMFLKSGIPQYIKVNPGARISVIADSVNGTLYITEFSP